MLSRHTTIFLLTLLLTGIHTAAQGQRTCGTEIYHQYLASQDTVYAEMQAFMDVLEDEIHFSTLAGAEVIIPVVVHILWNDPSQNISDQRILEQITVLNADFNALNSNIQQVPDDFRVLIGQLPVQFKLANRDPEGKPTNGIIRKRTDTETFAFPMADMKRSSTGGSDAWNTRQYLNIWVCNLPDNILGFATLPAQAGNVLDGVVINHRYFGLTGAISPFHLGRTATHEVGHWLNLRHIWGDDGSACTGSDFVEDTPNQAGSNSGCPAFPKTDACSPDSPGVMFMNYMDYTNDACMCMFSAGQAARMQTALSGPRSSILQSTGYTPPRPDDITTVEILSPEDFHCTGKFNVKARFSNIGSNEIQSFKAFCKIGQQAPFSTTWNGNLKPGDAITLSFPQPLDLQNGNYPIAVYTSLPNGRTDPDFSNDTIKKTFNIGLAEKIPLPYLEDFSSIAFPPDYWRVVNPDNQISWERSEDAFKSGNGSVVMRSFDYNHAQLNVAPGQIDDLVSPYFDLRHSTSARLSFWIAAAQLTPLSTINNRWDTLQILISSDCGQSYTSLYEKARFSLVTTSVPVAESFIPLSFQWRKEEVDLSSFIGNESVQLAFRSINHWENNIYLDDISFTSSNVTTAIDQQGSDFFQYYPNPSSEDIFVRFTAPLAPSRPYFKLTDILGREIFLQISPETEKGQYRLSPVIASPGVYLLQIDSGTSSGSVRVVRQ